MTTTQTADPKGGAMFDLDTHLAECKARMEAFVSSLLTPGTRCGDTFDSDGMTLVVNHLAYGHVDVEQVLDRTATPVEATLTSDGRSANTSAWHEGPAGDDEWVRVERFSARGMEFHGFVHAVSRRLLQTG